MVKKLPWYCKECEKVGILMFPLGKRIRVISNSVEKAHKERSPECKESGVRLVDPAKFPNRKMPKWAIRKIARFFKS